MNRFLVPLFASLLIIVAGRTVARADVTPPDEESCRQVAVGAACKVGGVNGTCRQTRCTKTDYSNRLDAGGYGTREVDCTKCLAGGATDAGSDSDRDEDDGCSVSGFRARRAGPWLLAGAFSLLFLRRRPRPQA